MKYIFRFIYDHLNTPGICRSCLDYFCGTLFVPYHNISTSRSSIFCSFNILSSWKYCYTALFGSNRKIVDNLEKLLLARIMSLIAVQLKKSILLMFRSPLRLLTFKQFACFRDRDRCIFRYRADTGQVKD